jgi:hypothetical protein
VTWSETLSEHDRVRAHTAPDARGDLDRRLEQRIAEYAGAPVERIGARLDELDREWDIERYLEVNATSLVALSTAATLVTRRRWLLLLPLAVALFLLQHGLQGWCPPLAIFRRRGVRTRREIDLERYALKVLRGDFSGGERPTAPDVAALLADAARR